MPQPYLHLLGIDPGATTGWAHFIIPRKSMFEDAPGEITDWSTGEITGPESNQVATICEMARIIQSLTYKVGPALIVEAFDFGSPLRDPEVYSPVRIGAMLRFCFEQTRLTEDATLNFQSRTQAFSTATDARLREWGLWVKGSEHERAATRHAITAIRRAKAKRAIRDKLWDPKYCVC